MAKGGGSANKTFLYQQTKALLNPVGGAAHCCAADAVNSRLLGRRDPALARTPPQPSHPRRPALGRRA
eukprot:SAG11_NODE_892_length_6673_cov_7.963797_6_plen_68_part_00